jgi:hypothetical protein
VGPDVTLQANTKDASGKSHRSTGEIAVGVRRTVDDTRAARLADRRIYRAPADPDLYRRSSLGLQDAHALVEGLTEHATQVSGDLELLGRRPPPIATRVKDLHPDRSVRTAQVDQEAELNLVLELHDGGDNVSAPPPSTVEQRHARGRNHRASCAPCWLSE